MRERLLESFDTKFEDTNILLVDIRSGHSHDLRSFHTRFPHHPGGLVLQDQAGVIQESHKLYESEN